VHERPQVAGVLVHLDDDEFRVRGHGALELLGVREVKYRLVPVEPVRGLVLNRERGAYGEDCGRPEHVRGADERAYVERVPWLDDAHHEEPALHS